MALKRSQLSGLDFWCVGGLSYDQLMTKYGYRHYVGPKGVAIYTVNADLLGYYYVMHARKAGPGLRTGNWNETYTMVPRLTTKRKSKKSAIDRAYTLAHGKSRQPLEPSKEKKDNHPMTGYCLSCKAHVIVDSWEERTTQSGRAMLEAWCPNCDVEGPLDLHGATGPVKGTRVTKFGKLIDCPGCGQSRPEKKGDYVCSVCRWELNNNEN